MREGKKGAKMKGILILVHRGGTVLFMEGGCRTGELDEYGGGLGDFVRGMYGCCVGL